MLPRSAPKSRGSSRKRKAAGFGLPSAWAVTRSHGFPPPRQAAMGRAAPRKPPFDGAMLSRMLTQVAFASAGACASKRYRSAIPPARRIGSTSRSESGSRTNPCTA